MCFAVAALATVALAFSPGKTLSDFAPIHLFESLHREYPKARIFNYREFGGALEYVGSPEWRVFTDGRLYLYDQATFDTYHAVAIARDSELLNRVVNEHDLFVLHCSYHAALIVRLRERSDLRAVSESECIAVFSKVG